MQIYAKKTNEMLKFYFFLIFLILNCSLEIPIKRVKNWDSSLGWFVKLGDFPIGVCLMYGSVMKRLLFALFFGAVGYGNR